MGSKDKKEANEGMNIGRFIRVFGISMGDQRRDFSMAGLMLIFEAATAVIIPLVGAYVIDYLAVRLAQIDGKAIAPPLSPMGLIGRPPLINPDIDTLILVTLGIIALTMVNSLADSMAEIYLAKSGRSLGYNLRVTLYAHLQKLSLAFHDQRRTGDILTRVTSDVAALEEFVITSLSDFVGSVLLIAFILVAMVLNAWQVALVAAVIIPIMALISNYFTQRIKAASKKRRASEGELASAAQEMLTSIRVIQTYGLGSYEQSLFAQQSQKAMDAALEAASFQARFSWVVSVMGAISSAAVIWMAVWLIFRNPVTASGIGLLTAYLKYIQDMFKPTKRIIQEWNTFGKLYASVERIGDLLDIQPSVAEKPGAVEAPRFQGRIEFRDVYFSYPTPAGNDGSKPRTALKNINFVIEPGEIVAVVGHTGAGKSTVVQLIPRLYDPNSGQVLIDGQDLRDFTLDSLRGQISMVLQESILFSGSVVENIAYGRPDASGPEIVAAARQANAHEFLEKLPQGYYTMLGERGSNLSGGQRQRIAIARAFIRNTPILILDEPTTGLDAESVDLVLRALHELMRGKTTIIISHDLNLIRNADKIIVINEGQVEQIGTHTELLQAGGLYANLYRMQMGQAEIPVENQLPGEAIPGESIKDQGYQGGKRGSLELYDLLEDDLPRSPQFRKTLPGLTGAFDSERMKGVLSDTLLDRKSNGYRIEACTPGKGIYLPGHTAGMQYSLKIQPDGKALINALLFQDASACQEYFDTHLAPLLAQASGREEFRPFAKAAAVIPEMNMVVSVFPLDGQIPTLLGATDPERMLNILNQTFPEALSGSFDLQRVCLDLAHYGRYRRCVLRYSLEGEDPETHVPQNRKVYGKVDASGLGGLTVSVISTLREKLQEPGTVYPFRIPRSLGYLPDLKLLIMEALPGEPAIKTLIQAWIKSQGEDPAERKALEEAIDVCARIAVTLHQSGIKLGRRRAIEDEFSRLRDEIGLIQEVFPEFGKRLAACMDEIAVYAESTPPMPARFSHGDYTYTQLIFDGKEAGLVDFDTVCQAEPAMDLGQFMAYQRLTVVKEQDPAHPVPGEEVDRLAEHFLASYQSAANGSTGDEAHLRARVAAYELISLLRLSVHSWQKLKGARLRLAVELLEERMACLKQTH